MLKTLSCYAKNANIFDIENLLKEMLFLEVESKQKES